MKKIIIAILLLAAGLLPTKADNITVDGTSRSYIAYAPQNLGENRPLFIFCHGSGQDANYMLNTQFRDTQNPERKISIENVCDTAKFVIVFPNGIDNQWDISGNRDINFVKALIDKMVTQHKIDRNRVYLGGFSMGGMFTYHAMNKIPDLIAAFVPVSGYPMGGATANASVRPLPILHIHGTADNVCGFSGVQPALNVWINHNGCPTTAQVTNNYNGFSGAKMHSWGPGNDGVYVKLLELPNKGHWVCKEPQVYTGKEMWNFCKSYSLKAVATDNDGETSTASVEVTLQAPTTLTVSSDFKEGGALPAGWTTYDGKERRVGYSNGYYLGCRVLQFTGSPRGLNYGLYFRNVEGKARQGWAKYGLSDGGTTLTLAPGHYMLKYKICNWNKPEFSPVELNIEKRTGSMSVAKQTYTPTINIGNVASNSFGNLEQQTFEFDITEQGDYAIALYTADVEYGDCILGQLILSANSYGTTGIISIDNGQFSERECGDARVTDHCIYDLQGRQVSNPRHGLYIKNGKKIFVR